MVNLGEYATLTDKMDEVYIMLKNTTSDQSAITILKSILLEYVRDNKDETLEELSQLLELERELVVRFSNEEIDIIPKLGLSMFLITNDYDSYLCEVIYSNDNIMIEFEIIAGKENSKIENAIKEIEEYYNKVNKKEIIEKEIEKDLNKVLDMPGKVTINEVL